MCFLFSTSHPLDNQIELKHSGVSRLRSGVFHRRLSVIVLLLIRFTSVQAQPVELAVHDLNFTNLPRITFDLCATSQGFPLTDLMPGMVSFRENGRPVPLDIRCPDTTQYNSVILVIDNSGSTAMSLSAIRTAAGRLVDSLRPRDECALLTFGFGITLAQDFTIDKSLLHAGLGIMVSGGGTPLFDAIWDATVRVTRRAGKRACVVLTDGSDNTSSALPDSIIALAARNGVTIHTLGYGPSQLDEQVLRKIASRTGGVYYSASTAGALPDIFDAIARSITSLCCRAEYFTTSCTEMYRRLQLSIDFSGLIAGLDTTVASPARPDTLTVRVVAPDEVSANGTAIVYLALEPGVAQGVISAFRVRLRYNPDLLTLLSLLPVTVGTMTEGQTPQLSMPQPGILELGGDYLSFARQKGNLIGIVFNGVPSDSSRPVPIDIISMDFSNGCPVVLKTTGDTIDVCQCKRRMEVRVDTLLITPPNDLIRIPIHAAGGMEPRIPSFISGFVTYDAHALDPVDITSRNGNHVTFTIAGPGMLSFQLHLPSPVRDSLELLCVLTFRTLFTSDPYRSSWSPVRIRIYQRCCPIPLPAAENTVLIDGACTPIARPIHGPSLLQNSPNPVHGEWVSAGTVIGFTLPHRDHVHIDLFDGLGRWLLMLCDADREAGSHQLFCDTSTLPSGIYFYRLTTRSSVQTKAMVVRR